MMPAGYPEEIFIHDVTEHFGYRGLDYELAGEICDMAAGGQILMGPKTYQRCGTSHYISIRHILIYIALCIARDMHDTYPSCALLVYHSIYTRAISRLHTFKYR